MATFSEANQVKFQLKMKLINYCWFKYATVMSDNDGYNVVITTNKLDNTIRKIIPQVVNGVGIRTEVD